MEFADAGSPNAENDRVPEQGASRARFANLEGTSDVQPLYRNVQWFRDGRVFEAHRLLYHSA